MSSGDGGTNPLGVIEGYQVFCNPDDQQAATSGEGSKQTGNQDASPATRRRSDSSDSEPPVHFQVKSEPVDPSYDQAAVSSPSSSQDNTGTATPPPSNSGTSTPVQISSSLWSGGKKAKETKKPDASVSNVIEQLLRKNEYLLAQNDAGGFKPNPRKSRNPNEMSKKPESALDSNGTTFLVSQTSQARIAKENPPGKTTGPGRILRPRSPTRKCSIPEKDKSHFNHAVMESKVNDKSSEKIFRVSTHEMVCAVSCQAMFMTQGGSLVAHFDLQFYWCNFCPYHTTNKAQLLQHVMEHRFHCKFCRYQSFSRADVIHHTAANHPDFSEAAATLKYCTLLSDYLQIYSQDTEEDKVKRAGGDPDDEPPSKISRLDAKDLSGLYANIDPNDPKKVEVYNNLQKDFEYFDMEVETVEGNVQQEDVISDRQVMGSQSAYDVSKMITNVQSSGNAIQVLLDKSQTQNQSGSVKPVSLVASQNMQSSPRYPGQSMMGPRMMRSPTPLRAPAPAKPFENRPPPPPPPANKRTGSVSSNLYWSCGYCNFTSHSQGEIKEHSQKTHRGRPHRYVALIRPPDKPADESNGNKNNSTSTVTSKDIEIDNAESSVSESSFAESARKTGDPPTYKCFHCSYEVKKPGLLKGHMSYKHRGLSLVGFDVQCQSPDKYMYFCPRDDCPFRAKNPTAYLNHVERCTPWHNKELNVTVEQYLLKCLDNTVMLAEKMKEQVRTMEEYSCIYCNFTGCFLENVAYHITTGHEEKSVIVKDLVMHRLRKKCFIYFCRFCDWETRNKEEWIEHGISQHQLALEDLRRDASSYGNDSTPNPKLYRLSKGKQFGKKKRKTASPPVLLPEGPIVGDMYVAGIDQAEPLDADQNPPKLIQASSVITTISEVDPQERLESTSPKMVSIVPPVLKCSHCPWTCIGVSVMKEHLHDNHSGSVLSFIDMQKKAQNLKCSFYLCPYETCIYSNSRAEGVSQHHKRTHAKKQESNGFSGESRPKMKVQKVKGFAKKSHSFKHSGNSVSLMPALLKCKYCTYSYVGVALMKEHIQKTHPGESFMYVNMKKRAQHAKSIFFICPYSSCVYVNTEFAKITQHHTTHDDDHPDINLKDVKLEMDVSIPESDLKYSEISLTNTDDYETCDDKLEPFNSTDALPVTFAPDLQGDLNNAKEDSPSTSDTLPSVEQPTKYICLLCETNVTTEQKQEMKEHYKSVHPEDDIVMRDLNARKLKRPSRLYMCRESTCLHHFLDSQSLLLHQLAHTNSPVFECSECGWSHPELVKVMNHLNDAHDSDDADINYVTLELEPNGKTVKKSVVNQSMKLENF